jgi:WD40 repeat protein
MDNTAQYVVHVWDRWGKETLLACHPTEMLSLEHSLDGEHLASGSRDGSIRIWRAESFHATSSATTYREGPSTRTPKQADIILLGSRYSASTALSFSQTNSNILASGGLDGEIKVWNVEEETCIHSFDPRGGPIHSFFFAGGADISCIAVAHAGFIIRLWRAEGSPDFASETIREADMIFGNDTPSAVFSPSGSFLATRVGSIGENRGTLALYEVKTMTKTQSVFMPDLFTACFAVSSDSKHLVYGGYNGRIQLLKTDDFSIQRDIDTKGGSSFKSVTSVAFDPTCRVLAIGCRDGRLEFHTL